MVLMLSVYAAWRYSECCCAESCYVEYRFAECLYVKCHYAEYCYIKYCAAKCLLYKNMLQRIQNKLAYFVQSVSYTHKMLIVAVTRMALRQNQDP
jgi:hypothetical protein